jgi:hypothetical protein
MNLLVGGCTGDPTHEVSVGLQKVQIFSDQQKKEDRDRNEHNHQQYFPTGNISFHHLCYFSMHDRRNVSYVFLFCKHTTIE